MKNESNFKTNEGEEILQIGISRQLLLETNYSNGFGMGKTENYKVYLLMPEGTIAIEVDGKEVSQNHYNNSVILTRIFSDAIDIDSWKHSWHLKVIDYLNKNVRDAIQKILTDKQRERLKEVEYLYNVEKVLMTQIVYEPELESEI